MRAVAQRPREPGPPAVAEVRLRLAHRVIGRDHEIDLLLSAAAAGRDIVLEGPPGTSKSTLLRALTAEWGIPFVFVEGNADLTPSKLIGHHNPARVLQEDYTAENFVEGPLVRAMRTGGFLYVEEFNRAPEDTLNTLLTAMAEREIVVPRLGVVRAASSFRTIASMNPFDSIGTSRLSTSIHDRLCRISVDYQDESAERAITAARSTGSGLDGSIYEQLIADAVAITRATRTHPDIRQGSSVRGAIDVTLVAEQLLLLRNVSSATADAYEVTLLDAVLVGLSGRIHLDEVADTTPEDVLREICEGRLRGMGEAAPP
jgi:MoxR-like ATPase